MTRLKHFATGPIALWVLIRSYLAPNIPGRCPGFAGGCHEVPGLAAIADLVEFRGAEPQRVRFAPHSLKVLEDSEIYDMGGKPQWFAFLQDYEAIRTYDPQRLEKPETLADLRKKFGVEVSGIKYEG